MDAKQFYHYIGRLIEHCRAIDTEASAKLKLLADWAHSYRDPILRDVEEKRKRGVITGDLIWALLEPGELVVVTTDFTVTNIDACGQCQDVWEERVDGELQQVKVKWRYISADNEHYGFLFRTIPIAAFYGERRIEDLAVFPLRCHPDYEDMRARLLARGSAFVTLTRGGAHHRQHVPAAYQNTPGVMPTGILNARIMVDYGAFVLPGLKEHLGLFPSITPGPTGWLDPEDFGDDELLCCSPIVVAFYLWTSKWGKWKTILFLLFYFCITSLNVGPLQEMSSWGIPGRSGGVNYRSPKTSRCQRNPRRTWSSPPDSSKVV